MKKFLVFTLTGLLHVGLISCGKTSVDNSSSSAVDTKESNSLTSTIESSDEDLTESWESSKLSDEYLPEGKYFALEAVSYEFYLYFEKNLYTVLSDEAFDKCYINLPEELAFDIICLH